MGRGFLGGVMGVFWNQTVVMVAQHCGRAESHCSIYFKMLKMVNFMLSGFYHN